jgi:hypothetical protein
MLALALALSLMAQDADAATPHLEDVAEAEELPYPPGAPKDDYGLVSWCYGALSGYLDLYDQVLPEVTRIESTYRRPDSNLAEDMKTYADLRQTSKGNLKLFARAMEAAEKASIQPINARGSAAVTRGRAAWAAAGSMPKARLAQEWMGWTLPRRCEPTATSLEKNATLLGAAFRTEEIAPEAPVAATPPEVPEAPSAPQP